MKGLCFFLCIKANELDIDWSSTTYISRSENPQAQNRILLILFTDTAIAKLGPDLFVANQSGKQGLHVCVSINM